MNSHPVLHRLSAALAASTLVLLVCGALIAGNGSPYSLAAAHSPWLRLHTYAAAAVAGLTLATLFGLLRSDVPNWLKAIGLAYAVGVVAAAGLGLPPRGPIVGVAHAVLSHALFALVLLLALGTSPEWNRKAAPLEDRGWPSLRALAWVAPAVALVQIALGAAYRFQVFSSIPHAAWAFPAVLLILLLATFTLTAADPGEHASLRRGSIALMALVSVQLVLGVAAFLGRMDPPIAFLSLDGMAALRATHLGTGALVFGFTVALAAQILRCAVRAAEPSAPEPAESLGRRG